MKTKYFEECVKSFLAIRSEQSQLPSSNILIHFALGTYFLQSLSVLFKINYQELSNPLDIMISRIGFFPIIQIY